ncbi:MAG: HIT family protein [Halobacteriales archaeon]|nr:HIT family protein [Halobacteriales archaeon]
MSCIFCRIVDGEASARTVYDTETTQAFLDANPLAPGHTLVIPKAHYTRLADLPVGLAQDVFTTIHAVTPAVETAVNAGATTIAFNNGRAAGQEVPHVHGHIVPRFKADGAGPIHRLFGSRPDLTETELNEIHQSVRDAI